MDISENRSLSVLDMLLRPKDPGPCGGHWSPIYFSHLTSNVCVCTVKIISVVSISSSPSHYGPALFCLETSVWSWSLGVVRCSLLLMAEYVFLFFLVFVWPCRYVPGVNKDATNTGLVSKCNKTFNEPFRPSSNKQRFTSRNDHWSLFLIYKSV